ncbi:MAG: helix-turn-helix transcriptional regulator [Rhodospirillaceae bacterium]
MAKFEHIVDRIYEAATEPNGWSTVLDELSRGVGAAGSVLLTQRSDSGWLGRKCSVEIASRFDVYMKSEAALQTQCTARLLAANRSGFVTDRDVFTDEEYLADPFMAEWGNANGYHHCAATAIHLPKRDLVIYHVQRRKGQPAFDSADIQFLDSFRPHLARAGLLAARWKLERLRVMAEALALLGLAAAIIASNGRVLASNTLIESMGSHVVWLPGDYMVFADPAATALLKRSVADLRTPAAPTVRSFPVKGADGEGLMVAHLIPTPGRARDFFEGGSGVLVLSIAAAPGAPDANLVAGLFDLTPAEARVACAIAGGQTVKEIAVRHAVGYETVRAQIKAVFAKTGTNQQSQVASLLAGLPCFPRRGG